MNLTLTYKGYIIGQILPELASIQTKELKGLLIPNNYYHQLRSPINKFNEVFIQTKSENLIDRILNKLLHKKYQDLSTIYSDFSIELNRTKITNENSEIRIIDNLINSGLGNPIIYIETWNLKTDKIEKDLETYEIIYKYPASQNNILEIKSKNGNVQEY